MINTFVIYGENVIDSAVATWQSQSRKIHKPLPLLTITDLLVMPLRITTLRLRLRS
jgi:hypothetical protein